MINKPCSYVPHFSVPALWFKEPSNTTRISTHHSSFYHSLPWPCCSIMELLKGGLVSPGAHMQRKCQTKVTQHQECFTQMAVEFQWVPCWQKRLKLRKKEEKKRKSMIIFLAFAACSAALPQAGLSAWTMNRKIDSAKLNMFLGCWLISPRTKYKDREGTKIEGTSLTL